MLRVLFVLLLSVHIVAAAVWVGGATMLEIVFQPRISVISKIQAGLVSRYVERRFTLMSWVALGTMSMTGLILTLIQGSLDLKTLFQPTGLVLLACMVLTAVAIIDGLMITYYFGPKLESVKFAESNLRNVVKFLIRMNSFIGVAVVVMMVIFTELYSLKV